MINLDTRRAEIAVQIIFYVSALYIFVSEARPLLFHLDAYYYFTIARNLSSGAGFTFDGVSTTTGFHPLWLGILTLLHSIFTGIGNFQVAVYVLSAGLFFAGHQLLTRAAVSLGISLYGFILASSIVFLVSLNIFNLGLENTLLFFLLSLFLWMQCRHWPNRLLFSTANALVLLLIYFARLDSIFILAAFSAWVLVIEWRSSHFLAAILVPTVLAVGILIHWGVMIAAVGTIFPTSQIAIKEVLSVPSPFLESLSIGGHPFAQRLAQVLESLGSVGDIIPLRYIGLCMPIGVAIATGIIAFRQSPFRWLFVLAGLSELFLIFYYAVYLNGFTHPWYFTGANVIIVLGFTAFLTTIIRNLRLLILAAAVAPVITAIVITQFGQPTVGWSHFAEETRVLKDYNHGDNVLVGYTPDLASYFSEVPIRHLEGLVNGYDFLNTYAKDDRITSYLKDIKATHYIISNDPVLPEFISCGTTISVNSDDGSVAYSVYDRHNSYIAVYSITITHGVDQSLEAHAGQMCGPTSGLGRR